MGKQYKPSPWEAVTPKVTAGLADITGLKAIVSPNVKLTGSYAKGTATPKSDIDILIGLSDAEWKMVSPRNPPTLYNEVLKALPGEEHRLTTYLYRISNPEDMMLFRRPLEIAPGKFYPGVAIPETDEALVSGLIKDSIRVGAIPKAPVTPKVKAR